MARLADRLFRSNSLAAQLEPRRGPSEWATSGLSVGVRQSGNQDSLRRYLDLADPATRGVVTVDLQRSYGNEAVAAFLGRATGRRMAKPKTTIVKHGSGTLLRDGNDTTDDAPRPVWMNPPVGHGEPDEVTMEGSGPISLHGQAKAKYDGGKFKTKGVKAETSTECGKCPPKTKCIHVTGSLVTDYKVTVTITLPPVPGDLTACEQKAVEDHINTTLRDHENEHKTRFETYNGRTENTFDLTGCGKADITRQLKGVQKGENQPREEAANKLSGAIDPFKAIVPMNCS